MIIGNLTGDPQSHTTAGGKDVCNFSVAVNRRRKVDGQPESDFFRVAAWGAIAGPCQKYLAKGRKVCVIGSVSVSTYQAQDGTTRASMEVFAEDVEFLSSPGTGGNNGGGQAPAQTPAEQNGGFSQVAPDDLPF